MNPGIFTIGHSTTGADEFLALLQANDLALLVDVRRFPASRRYPHYNSADMEGWLSEAGIGYVHFADLGGRRKPLADSTNCGWRNEGFRGYADYMQTPVFVAALDRLLELSSGLRAVIMCAEAVPWRCHRNLIADALVLLRDTPVHHIISKSPPALHVPTQFARVQDGLIMYTGDPPGQTDFLV